MQLAEDDVTDTALVPSGHTSKNGSYLGFPRMGRVSDTGQDEDITAVVPEMACQYDHVGRLARQDGSGFHRAT